LANKKLFDPEKTLSQIDTNNVNAFGKATSMKNASIFSAKNIGESVSKEFGSRLTKKLKKKSELDF